MKYLFARDTEVRSIEAATNDVRKRQLLVAVIDAVIAERQTGVLSEEGLSVLSAAMSESDEIVWARAGRWLLDLAGRHESATLALARLQADPQWRKRFNVAAMADEAPEDLARSLIMNGLKDKSSRVRSKAVDAAFRCDFPFAVDLVASSLSSERDAKIRSLMEFYLPLMRGEVVIADGFETRRTPGGGLEGVPVKGG